MDHLPGSRLALVTASRIILNELSYFLLPRLSSFSSRSLHVARCGKRLSLLASKLLMDRTPGVSCISGGAETGGDEEGKGTAGRRESRGRSGPFVLSITLPASDYRSDTFRVTPATPSRPSPDYSLVDGIAAASSTSSSSLCPPRETDFQPMSDHLNKTRKRGRGIEERVVAGGRGEGEESGRGTFEVRSTRLTGVDQISEGEIIQGRRRRDRDKAPPSWLTISEPVALFLTPFPSCLVLSSRASCLASSVSGAPALIPKSIRKRICSTVRKLFETRYTIVRCKTQYS
ncbi:hypothetical protein DBV15_07583 [Temnothorax longispinosus]|uniref:Uncharacterized protein n=1 Tax=Temnothorax longispinosus TaxID=300112 RepID=A0A4S2L4N1_9HYME|nr:hypothetical protein DBV15_07583 [Temnothorax longispinosus]